MKFFPDTNIDNRKIADVIIFREIMELIFIFLETTHGNLVLYQISCS